MVGLAPTLFRKKVGLLGVGVVAWGGRNSEGRRSERMILGREKEIRLNDV